MAEDWREADKIHVLRNYLRKTLEFVVEEALTTALSRDPLAREEGSGVWNSSRAPHCYGYEYEQEFGAPFCLRKASAVHKKAWRDSKWWPNIPPTQYFYPDHSCFEEQCKEEFEERLKDQYHKELQERKRRRKAYDLAYNEVRRGRRRARKVARQKSSTAFYVTYK